MPSEGPVPRVILLTRSCVRKETLSGVWEARASRTHGKCGLFSGGRVPTCTGGGRQFVPRRLLDLKPRPGTVPRDSNSSPPSAGDPATTLSWGLLGPPPTIRGLHLHLGQVSLVLTLLVGSWVLPGLEDAGRVGAGACTGQVLRTCAVSLQGDRPPRGPSPAFGPHSSLHGRPEVRWAGS